MENHHCSFVKLRSNSFTFLFTQRDRQIQLFFTPGCLIKFNNVNMGIILVIGFKANNNIL